LIDLQTSPPSNSYLTLDQLASPEKWYPLRVLVCEKCWLVQTEDYALYSELFSSNYAYFSSYSSSWLDHAEKYVNESVKRFGLDVTSRVVEVASNDGYLLQFLKRKGIPCIGIEPTASTASAAREKGIEVIEDFFGTKMAKRLGATGFAADLTVANNVLAHVPDINDFVEAFVHILKRDGVATFEFPHLMRLVELCQFDTIYHEHFSYLSLSSVQSIFDANGLSIFDVEEIDTHGGSLRVYAQRKATGSHRVAERVAALLDKEAAAIGFLC
jgi:SAM-dependent methyltransferase